MTQLPKLADIALISLSVPVNSVTAKRSYSFYSDIYVMIITALGRKYCQCTVFYTRTQEIYRSRKLMDNSRTHR